MAKPYEILSPEDYSNYRNIRAVSVLFVLSGCLLAIGSIGLAFNEEEQTKGKFHLSSDGTTARYVPLDEEKPTQGKNHPAIAVGLAIVGLAGAIGGIAALGGSRKWAPLVYVIAALFLIGFPVWTILSVVMFRGLSRYLDSVERIKLSISKNLGPDAAAAPTA